MQAKAPSKAIYTGILNFDSAHIPVKIYKGYEPIQLHGQSFHEACSDLDGKIRQHKRCELHPDMEFPAVYSAIMLADESGMPLQAKLTKETRAALLGASDCNLEVVSSHKLNTIGQMLLEQRFVSDGVYQIGPQEFSGNNLALLLSRLTFRKRFLLLTCPIQNTKRYMLLLPNGQIFALLYQEEIRALKFDIAGMTSQNSNKENARKIDALLEEYSQESIPALSAADILARIQNWIAMQQQQNIKTITAIPKRIRKRQKQNA